MPEPAARRKAVIRVAAAVIGVTATTVGVLVMLVRRWVVAVHDDCLRSPCFAIGHPYLGLGALIVVMGLLVALIVWNSVRGEPVPPAGTPPRGSVSSPARP